MLANLGIFPYHALKVVQKCFIGNLQQHSCKKMISNIKLMLKDAKENKHFWVLYTFKLSSSAFYCSVSLLIKLKFQNMFLLKVKKEKTDVTINKSNYLMESSKVKENKPIQCLHYQKKKKRSWG